MSAALDRFMNNGNLDIDSVLFGCQLVSLEASKLELRNRYRFYNWSSSWRMAISGQEEMSVELLWGKHENERPSYYPDLGIDANTKLSRWKSVFVVNLITPNRLMLGRSKRIIVPVLNDSEDSMRGYVKSHTRYGGEAGRLASNILVSESQINSVVRMAERFIVSKSEVGLEEDIKLAIVTTE